MTTPMKEALSMVQSSLREQQLKWGKQSHNQDRWHTILMEEVGEAAEEILEDDGVGYVIEMSQVAAVAIAAIESFLSNRGNLLKEMEKYEGALTEEDEKALGAIPIEDLIWSAVQEGRMEIIDWEGVTDQDGNPVPFSREAAEEIVRSALRPKEWTTMGESDLDEWKAEEFGWRPAMNYLLSCGYHLTANFKWEPPLSSTDYAKEMRAAEYLQREWGFGEVMD